MKVLSEECECENMPKQEVEDYVLHESNCKPLHDMEGADHRAWHYLVISCGSRTNADSVRRALLKQSNIVSQLRKHYDDSEQKHRDRCTICIYIQRIFKEYDEK